MITSLSELPNPTSIDDCFIDFETTSFDETKKAFHPYLGHRICGIAFTYDSCETAYYIPIRHRGIWSEANLPLEPVLAWLKDTLNKSKRWINHNVKFDANFAYVDGIDPVCEMLCTVVLSKLIDSDLEWKGLNYGLDTLAKHWLLEDIDGYGKKLEPYLGRKNKDYAFIPPDILGEYACVDVLINRRLYYYLLYRRSASLKPIWNMEKKLTPVLFDMEKKGLRIDRTELMIKQLKIYDDLSNILTNLSTVAGSNFNPVSNGDCYDLICNHFGLPILAYTKDFEPEFDDYGNVIRDEGSEEGDGASFNKHALELYLAHHEVITDPKKHEIISQIQRYRSRNTLLTLFVNKFLELADSNSILHPSYNQLVRTGRMSCRNPNAQQQNSESKELIHPHSADKALLCQDASQIEFRLIGEFIGDPGVIEAYAADPDTDFHDWVAKMCGIGRKPGKTLNFTIAFGGGKEKIISKLETNDDFVKTILVQMENATKDGHILPSQRETIFKELARRRANEVYTKYHDTLPGIKRMSRIARDTVLSRGYVRNPFGRERHLTTKGAHRAFNTVIQGWASDIIKAGMLKLAPRYCEYTRNLGVDVLINVHDEITFHGPKEVLKSEEFVANTSCNLEETLIPLRVPLRFGCGYSEKSWGQAGNEGEKADKKLPYPRLGYGIRPVNRSLRTLSLKQELSDYEND